MASTSQNALIGRAVAGRFTITRFLGEGGMATVYVAEQDAEPRELALKIMNEELTADRSFVKRFQREAKAAAKVQHPNSVSIIDYGIADGLSYIAMELLRGDDLYVLLERDGALPQTRAVRILAEVCDVLSAAHELGIVHRDLKPENIMVIANPADPKNEHVKVLDFGIAKLLAPDVVDAPSKSSRDSENTGVTRAGTFIGTPAYMSPEQCNLQTVDTRADIYTCGVLLFQLVTGRTPFEGLTPLHTATMHVHQETPKPSSFAPTIDPRLETVILKALQKKPADRYQTAKHLGATLRKLLPEIGEVKVAVGPPSKRQLSMLKSGVSSAPGSPRTPRAPVAPVAPPPAPKRMDLGSTMVDTGDSRGPARVLLHEGAEGTGPASEPPTMNRALVPADPGLLAEITGDGPGPSSEISEVTGRRYGPQRTEVIESPLTEDPPTPLRDLKSTLKSTPGPRAPLLTPNPEMSPASGSGIHVIHEDTGGSAPQSVSSPHMPVPFGLAPPSSVAIAHVPISPPSMLTTQPLAPGFVALSPAPGQVAPPQMSAHPQTFDFAAPRAKVGATSSMTRGILIGFLAAVLLMGVAMVAIVLLTRP